MSAPPAVDVGGRALARNALYNVLGQGLPLAFALVAVPVLLRGLGEARFGVLGLVWMFVTLMGELGFGRAATRYAAEELGAGRRGAVARLTRVTLAAQLVLGVGLGGALALGSEALVGRVLAVDPGVVADARSSFLILGAALPVLTVGSVFRGLLEAAQRFGSLNAVRFTGSSLNYLLPVAALAVGWGLPALVALLMALRLGMTLGFAAAARDLVSSPPPDGAPAPGGPSPREILGFGAWVTVSTVVSPVLVYLDRFLLGALVSVAAVGIYTAPYEVVTRILLIPGSVAATLFPAVSALRGMGRASELRRTSRRAAGAILATVGPVAVLFAVFAAPILDLWLGPASTPDAAAALRLLAPGVVANALAFVPYSILQGLGRADVTARLHLVELPLHALAAWWLIARFGVAGAAGAWSLRTTLDAGLLFLVARAVGRSEAAP